MNHILPSSKLLYFIFLALQLSEKNELEDLWKKLKELEDTMVSINVLAPLVTMADPAARAGGAQPENVQISKPK